MRTLTHLAWRDGRTRTLLFSLMFAFYAYIQPEGYRSAYPTLVSRTAFAAAFGDDTAIRIFYGAPRQLLTVGGYAAWRVAGTLTIFAAVWGLLAAVRATRTEEESGRSELVLSLPISRASLLGAGSLAIAAGAVLLWLAEFGGSALAGLAVGSSAYMALATVTVALCFAAVGALVSQLASTRRAALAFGAAILVVCLMLRVVADTVGGLSWLRWLTPLGWAENMDPFTGARAWIIVLPVVFTAALAWSAARLMGTRDIGTGLIKTSDSSPPRMGLLQSATAYTLRLERTVLIIWALGLAAGGFVVGTLSSSTGNGAISGPIKRELTKLGAGSIATPSGYLSLTLLFFMLILCLFVCAQLGAAQSEEEEGRLETMLAQPVGRQTWFGGRVGLAAIAAVTLALVCTLAAWAGAAAVGEPMSVLRLAGSGLNFLPVALLFLGCSSVAYATVPRFATAISYALVIAAFLWELVASLLSVPSWLRNATPFAHVGLMPSASPELGAAVIMLAIAAVLIAIALVMFDRRDVGIG